MNALVTITKNHLPNYDFVLFLELRPDDIHSVEIVGGSTRIPALKQLIEKVFGRTPSTTLNQDEAVSRGCALQCAMLSPAVRVRDFSVTDVQPYPIKLSWDASMGEDTEGEMEVFPANHPTPFSKLLTFYRREPFAIRASYSENVPYPVPEIGKYLFPLIFIWEVDSAVYDVKLEYRGYRHTEDSL